METIQIYIQVDMVNMNILFQRWDEVMEDAIDLYPKSPQLDFQVP